MSDQQSCIFCGIAAGRVPCHRVYEDDAVLAFMDVNPAADGHTLVIPRGHAENVFDIDETSMTRVAVVVRRVARALNEALGPDGINVVQANGPAAGQTVFHYHVHLIPRTEGERLRMHGKGPGEPERLAEMASAIAERLVPGNA